MKKILCIILVIIMTLILVACGKDKVTETEPVQNPTIGEITDATTDTQPVTEPQETEPENIWETEGIRKNGYLPDYYGDLTDEELKYYHNKIFTALQTLDLETLAEYSMPIEGYENVLNNLKTISQNEKYKKMYEQTFGECQYLPDSMLVIYKDRLYLFNKWVEEMENQGKQLPANTSCISTETVDEWYSKYYNEIPNFCQTFDQISFYKLKDGKIQYNLKHILSVFWSTSLDVEYTSENEESLYSTMLFYDIDLSDGYEALKERCPQYKDVLTLDLDKVVNYFEQETHMSTDDSYYECFSKCYKDKNMRKEVQKWVNENCFATRGFYEIKIYVPVCVEKDSLFKNCTTTELQILKDANLYFSWGVSFNDFTAYDVIIETMTNFGRLNLGN